MACISLSSLGLPLIFLKPYVQRHLWLDYTLTICPGQPFPSTQMYYSFMLPYLSSTTRVEMQRGLQDSADHLIYGREGQVPKA
ncbi:hypothetical protein CPC08DRAFT_704383 [Agrocybe pediades]|nr:hypothetical protein CPC08DRAFT_704383 [Agrocybe pediades]